MSRDARALFRHVRSLRGGVRIIIQPNDGRPQEEFHGSDAELRRLAWSLLADLAPQEARAAAAEDGVDLAAQKNPTAFPFQGRLVRDYAPKAGAKIFGPKPDSDQHIALVGLAGGPQTAQQWAGRFSCKGAASEVFSYLTRMGFAVRTDDGPRNRPATYAITDAGQRALQATLAQVRMVG
jgi:hypothetical protein